MKRIRPRRDKAVLRRTRDEFSGEYFSVVVGRRLRRQCRVLVPQLSRAQSRLRELPPSEAGNALQSRALQAPRSDRQLIHLLFLVQPRLRLLQPCLLPSPIHVRGRMTSQDIIPGLTAALFIMPHLAPLSAADSWEIFITLKNSVNSVDRPKLVAGRIHPPVGFVRARSGNVPARMSRVGSVVNNFKLGIERVHCTR